METLWRSAPASVYVVVAALVGPDLDNPTVMTTMDRHHKKGLKANTPIENFSLGPFTPQKRPGLNAIASKIVSG